LLKGEAVRSVEEHVVLPDLDKGKGKAPPAGEGGSAGRPTCGALGPWIIALLSFGM